MVIINENNSTGIKSFIYNSAVKTLKIRFNNNEVVEYENVEESVYQNLCSADSQIKYFKENIENNYSLNKLLID